MGLTAAETGTTDPTAMAIGIMITRNDKSVIQCANGEQIRIFPSKSLPSSEKDFAENNVRLLQWLSDAY
jgi:hypothetical protein